MNAYIIDEKTCKATELNRYDFRSEGIGLNSLQSTIANNPEIILDLPELELQNEGNIIVCREYTTNSGPIDILMITSNADIIIIETKLLRNPESHRTVVAQAIDYAKAFYNEKMDELINKISKMEKLH